MRDPARDGRGATAGVVPRLLAVPLFLLGFSYAFSLSVGGWIVCRFGRIPFWLIVANAFESPAVLPVRDILILGSALPLSIGVGLSLAVAFVALCRRCGARYGKLAALAVALAMYAAMAYAAHEAYDLLDGWFAIRNEIACRRVKSDYFARNFKRVSPADVTYGDRRMNLVVILSESLEEGFAEGALGGENLLPGLVEWRKGGFRADTQCQIAGASFTSAVLTSLFYGIPRVRLDGSVALQDTERYPRFSIPSIWDVFLAHGYACAYVQGGTFEFGSKGRLFPETGDFRKLGFSDLCNDPAYLAEPEKNYFGVNDNVMFRYLKRESVRLMNGGKPFVLVGLTLDPHCPDGWCSAFVPRGNRGKLAESILAQDRMICDYLDWLEKKSCASNTVVVVLGDHYYWGREFRGDTPRRVFNAVRMPGTKDSPFKRPRRFSAIDWAPTLIELTGGVVPEEGRFGMGVSLLRETPTLLESSEVSRFDNEMQMSLSDYWDIVLRK